jgi:hypothetical protein
MLSEKEKPCPERDIGTLPLDLLAARPGNVSALAKTYRKLVRPWLRNVIDSVMNKKAAPRVKAERPQHEVAVGSVITHDHSTGCQRCANEMQWSISGLDPVEHGTLKTTDAAGPG